MAVTMLALSARRPSFNSKEDFETNFCYSLSRHKGQSTAGRITALEKCTVLTANRTRDLSDW
jgi:hypothetical protein